MVADAIFQGVKNVFFFKKITLIMSEAWRKWNKKENNNNFLGTRHRTPRHRICFQSGR